MTVEMYSLRGKVAVVTGASRGLGRAAALGCPPPERTSACSVLDLESVAAEIAAMGRCALVPLTDVTDRAQLQTMVDRTVAELGGLDVLVNNAGGARFMAPLLGLRPGDGTKTRALNLDAVFHGTQIAAQTTADRGRGGSLVQIASVAGFAGAPGLSFYSAAKGAVRLFTQAVALAAANVRVKCVAPGWLDTPLNAWATRNPSTLRTITSTIPMDRLGRRPEEVVGEILLLASDAGRSCGTTIVVDGGGLRDLAQSGAFSRRSRRYWPPASSGIPR